MKSFVTRTVSGLVALFLALGLYYFLGLDGLKLLTLFVVILADYELLRILFKPEDSKLNRFVFFVFVLCIFLLSSDHPSYSGVIFSFFSISFCLLSLVTQNKFEDLPALTAFQAKSILGFLYLGLLPSFVISLLGLSHGLVWFLLLLGVVFGGDIGAYIVGSIWGKNRLMPLISPKKTIEGSVGGLACSVLVSLFLGRYLPSVSTWELVALAIAAAISGQFGDLFESQLKRVADIKDSGAIMPGHGGVLDRIDGVLFAAPIIYLGALFLERLI